MEVKEFKAKTVDEAITAATLELGISSDKLQYEVVDEGSKGFLGIFNSKPAVIKVILKKSLLERTGILRRIICCHESGNYSKY